MNNPASNNVIFAIDPGKNTGLAWGTHLERTYGRDVKDDGKSSVSDCVIKIYKTCFEGKKPIVLIEDQIIRSLKNAKAIKNLIEARERVSTQLQCRLEGVEIIKIPVAQWKGNLSKELTLSRLNDYGLKFQYKVSHNVVDAVGILYYYFTGKKIA